MTDAQSFYLLLSAFYLYECLSFTPHGAWAFVGRGGSRWRWRNPAFHLSGAHKDAFCAPVIPWPGLIAVFPSSESGPISPLARRHLRRRTLTLSRITGPLRLFSLAVFLYYFLLLPIAYHFLLGSVWMIAVILAGEALAFLTAIRFYCLHKRLFPADKGERRLETLFNAFLPWHAMRASDLIVKKMTSGWHPLVCLASHPHSAANLKELARLWRKAAYERNENQLRPILEQAGIDPTPWTLPPELENPDQKFCPLCHTVYESQVNQCADCQEVHLQHAPNSSLSGPSIGK